MKQFPSNIKYKKYQKNNYLLCGPNDEIGKRIRFRNEILRVQVPFRTNNTPTWRKR